MSILPEGKTNGHDQTRIINPHRKRKTPQKHSGNFKFPKIETNRICATGNKKIKNIPN